MATIIVEDGSIVENANSYVTTNELQTYATDRGITLTNDLSELLIKASDYVESFSFKGIKYSATQSMQWPRSSVYIDSYLVDDDEIPQLLKNAQMATAVAIDEGNNPLATIIQNAKRKKVDTLEIEYFYATSTPIIKTIYIYLNKLIASGNGNFLAVSKA